MATEESTSSPVAEDKALPKPCGTADEQERVSLVVHGQVSCDEDDEEFVKRWIFAAAKRCDPDALTVDKVHVADPLEPNDVTVRPLFNRATLRPLELTRQVKQSPVCFPPPAFFVRSAAWATIIGTILRAGSAQPEMRLSSRRGFSIAGAVFYSLSWLLLLPGLQPAVLLQHVILTFDFWYLCMHVVAVAFLEFQGLSGDVHESSGENVAVHIVFAAAALFGHVAAEAYALSPAAKAGRYILLAGICGVEILIWAVAHGHRNDAIEVGIFTSTVGAAAQTAYLGLAAFMLRATLATLSGRRTPPFLPLPCDSVIR